MSIEGGYVGKKGSRGHRKWVSREQEVNMIKIHYKSIHINTYQGLNLKGNKYNCLPDVSTNVLGSLIIHNQSVIIKETWHRAMKNTTPPWDLTCYSNSYCVIRQSA